MPHTRKIDELHEVTIRSDRRRTGGWESRGDIFVSATGKDLGVTVHGERPNDELRRGTRLRGSTDMVPQSTPASGRRVIPPSERQSPQPERGRGGEGLPLRPSL